MYSDIVVKPENKMTETERVECYPISPDAEENGRNEGYYPDSTVAYIRILWKEYEPEQSGVLIPCWNKCDISGTTTSLPPVPGFDSVMRISAVTGESLETLADKIENAVWGSAGRHESEHAVSERHAAQLKAALPCLADACTRIQEEDWELAATGLHEAVHALGIITGEDANPDILDEIFSRFCIGK